LFIWEANFFMFDQYLVFPNFGPWNSNFPIQSINTHQYTWNTTFCTSATGCTTFHVQNGCKSEIVCKPVFAIYDPSNATLFGKFPTTTWDSLHPTSKWWYVWPLRRSLGKQYRQFRSYS
jgi:hypothetical protein